jgi:tRNA threonylcarbamoyl adenosine modification protein YeaZ
MILAIETSSPQASLSLFDSGKEVWGTRFETDRSHNSKIFAPLCDALDFCDRKLDFIAIGIGPGSYSGVRVGIAAANGISLALDVPVVGVSSLEAYDAGDSDYLVVGDARRKTFFVAAVSKGIRVGEPELMDQDEFEKRICLCGDQPVFTMDQVVSDQYQTVEHRYPAAENIAIRAACRFGKGRGLPLKPVEPHYLRAPYITKAKKKPVPGFPK